jgi:hypothetical protein
VAPVVAQDQDADTFRNLSINNMIRKPLQIRPMERRFDKMKAFWVRGCDGHYAAQFLLKLIVQRFRDSPVSFVPLPPSHVVRLGDIRPSLMTVRFDFLPEFGLAEGLYLAAFDLCVSTFGFRDFFGFCHKVFKPPGKGGEVRFRKARNFRLQFLNAHYLKYS